MENRFKKGRLLLRTGAPKERLAFDKSIPKKGEQIVISNFAFFSEEIDLFKTRDYHGDHLNYYYSWGGEGGLCDLRRLSGKSLAVSIMHEFIPQITTKGVRTIDFVSHIVVMTPTPEGLSVVVHALTSDQIFALGKSCEGIHTRSGDSSIYETKLGRIVLHDFYRSWDPAEYGGKEIW